MLPKIITARAAIDCPSNLFVGLIPTASSTRVKICNTIAIIINAAVKDENE
jgi:hypothetical protein